MSDELTTGKERAEARLAAVKEWQEEYYKDTPAPILSRQQTRFQQRKISTIISRQEAKAALRNRRNRSKQ